MFFPVWFFLFSNRINYWKAKKNQGHFSSSLSIVWAVINPENGKLNFMFFFCMWNKKITNKKKVILWLILEPKNINFQPKIFKLFFLGQRKIFSGQIYGQGWFFIYHWCFEKQESFLVFSIVCKKKLKRDFHNGKEEEKKWMKRMFV